MTPPVNLDAERAVVGAVLVSPKAFGVASDILEPEHFYSEKNRIVFRAVASLVEEGKPVDRVTVTSKLSGRPDDSSDATARYVYELIESVPTAANVGRYAETVRSLAFRRELLDLSSRVGQAAEEGEDEAVEAAQKLHEAATRTRADEDVYTFATDAEGFKRRVVLRSEGLETMGIPTGLSKLDRATTGYHPGDLVVIGARPSMGKTVWVWQSAITAARHGNKVFVMNLEMAYERIQDRCACATSGISYEDWRRGKFGDSQAGKLIRAYDALSGLPIHIHNPRAGRSFSDLRRAVRALKPDVVFVDYLQLLASEKAARSDLYTAVTLVSNDLKQLAVSEKIPVVCAAQLGRDVEKRDDKRPVMSDLRESGYIEQDADVVLMMYRDAYYYPEGEKEGRHGPEKIPGFHPQRVEFIARKDREGGNWATDAFFHGAAMWMNDHPYGEERYA